VACLPGDNYPGPMAHYASPEEEWHDFLSGTHPHLHDKSPLRFIPSNPRCKLCKAPFGGPGAVILRRYGFTPWPKNPKVCGRCFKGLQEHASMCPGDPAGSEVRGAEVELSMLFADVRGSSKLARQMSTLEFTGLMDRFYRASTQALVELDAIIEKFVGDEVVGLFLPFMTGPDHATRAVEAARALFAATGYGSAEGPWVPLGAGVHTGIAFVGVVGGHDGRDFTALGDPMNIAAHLASQAAAGEILITQPVVDRAALASTDLERRHVSLKGYPLDAFVLPTQPATAPTG
jgi:adenylate cyclase